MLNDRRLARPTHRNVAHRDGGKIERPTLEDPHIVRVGVRPAPSTVEVAACLEESTDETRLRGIVSNVFCNLAKSPCLHYCGVFKRGMECERDFKMMGKGGRVESLRGHACSVAHKIVQQNRCAGTTGVLYCGSSPHNLFSKNYDSPLPMFQVR